MSIKSSFYNEYDIKNSEKHVLHGLSVVFKITTRRSTIDVLKKSDLPEKIGPLVHPHMSWKYGTGPNLFT